MVTAIQQTSLAQSKKPLLSQLDLRCVRDPATRILNLRGVAPYLSHDLTRGELQLLAACDAVCELIQGELGEDSLGDPIGNLLLKESPTLPAAQLPKLDNGATNV